MTPPFSQRLWRAWKRRIWIKALRRFHPEVDAKLPHNKRFRVDLRDQIVSSLLYLQEPYESEMRNLIESIDLKGMVCVDIGAHMGLHTLELSEAVGPQGRVYAFEPQSRNFELLQKNLGRNNAKNVIARRAAVGERAGSCRLAVHPTNYGDHRIAAGSGGTEEVPVVTIDSALGEVPEASIGLIKIDVQGYETYVVRGMKETLRRNPDAILIIEVFPEGLQSAGSSASELVETLRGMNLDGWEFQDFRVLPCQEPHIYDLIRGGKHEDLVLSHRGKKITEVLERLYGQRLRDRNNRSVMA